MSTSLVRLFAAAGLLLTISCTQTVPASSRDRLVSRSNAAMGAELQLTARTTDEPAAESAFEAAFQEGGRPEGFVRTRPGRHERPTTDSHGGRPPRPVWAPTPAR